MIRKYLSVAVIFVMLFYIPVCAGTTYTQQNQTDYIERVKMLEAFKILDGTLSNDISATITRVEFSKLIVNLMGYEVSSNAKPSFSDLDSKMDGLDAINIVANLGYLNGFNDGTFRPNELVTYEQAIKIVVCILGYEHLAAEKGGYPNGYIQTAQNIGLINKVEGYAGYPLTYDNLTKMIENSLEIDFMMKTATGAIYNYSIIEDRNILSYNLKLEKRKGVILANEYTQLNESAISSKNSINIDGEIYKVEGNYNSLIGCRVEFYVNNDDNSDEIIRFIKSPEKLNDIVTVSGENVDAFRDRTYYYFENGNDADTKEADVPPGAYVIINGKLASSYDDNEMLPLSGTLKLIDNNRDGNYDVISIVRYEHYVVQSVDANNQRVYDKYDTSKVLNVEAASKNYLSIYDTDGKRLNLEGLKEWDILSVSQSKDGEIANIIVSRKSIEGSIAEIDNSDDIKLKIGDKEYKVLEGFDQYLKLSMSKFGTFYLNKDGEISAFSVKNAPDSGYAYLIKAKLSTTGVDKDIEFKLLDSEDNMRYLKGAKKIKVDINPSQNPQQVFDALKNGTADIVPQIIKYTLNIEGNISEIDMPYNNYAIKDDVNTPDINEAKDYTNIQPVENDDAEGLRITHSGIKAPTVGILMYRGNHMTFRGKVNISSKTVMFRVPADITTAEDEDFSVVHTNYFKHDFEYSIEAYSSSSTSMIADALIVIEGSGNETDMKVGAVSKINKAIDKDGTTIMKLQLQTYMGIEDVYTDDELMINEISSVSTSANKYSLEVGDIVKYYTNSRLELTSIYLVIDSSGDLSIEDVDATSVVKFTNVEDYLKMDRLFYGHVYDKQDDVISLSAKTDLFNKPTDLENQRLTGYKILMFDTKSSKPKFVPASSKDIYDYKHSLDNRSNVFLYTEYADQRLMVIYR